MAGSSGSLPTQRTVDQGLYVAPELPVGYYTVRVESSGLTKMERLHVKVDVGGETRADAALSVQSTQQSVAVSAAAPVLQCDSSAFSEVLEPRQVQDLPLNGRDFRRLAFLLAGAAPRSPRGS